MEFNELKEGMRVKWGESEGRIVKLYTSHAWAEFKNTIHVPENLYPASNIPFAALPCIKPKNNVERLLYKLGNN